MYLTSFAHSDELFNIAERWFCGQLHPEDGRRLTQILICDGFILAETLKTLTEVLLSRVFEGAVQQKRIRFKGELRDAICRAGWILGEREQQLLASYRNNPEFYYREAPIDGCLCLGPEGQLLGLYRMKRTRRIAEKANRKIASWIFKIVQGKAQQLAEVRAQQLGIPIEFLVTPEPEMVREFAEAELAICESFSRGEITFDRAALTIHDVGGMKVIGSSEQLDLLEASLLDDAKFKMMDRESFHGDYRARSMVLEFPWDPERVFQCYRDQKAWKRYLYRGIPEAELEQGLEPLLLNPRKTINVELILSNVPDMVDSEFGSSIHEERILAQRDNKNYKGYVPTNVEFLLEYLFAVGFSPEVNITSLPIKLWGRYLPDTLISHIRSLYRLPEHDLFY
jgi:hypothetical protein